jgi:iron only hydrogenase large subunit-like protein
MEFFYSDLIPHVSTCKSPHEMQGAITKSYFCEKHGLDPKNVFVVSIMPCTAKKYEAQRPQNAAVEHLPDIDAVLTTRELAVMIKRLVSSGTICPKRSSMMIFWANTLALAPSSVSPAASWKRP